MRGRQAPRGRPCGRQRDLLAEDRAHRELGPVDGPRHAQPGRGAHERPDDRVGAQARGHGAGVGVEVEQPPAALHGARAVARVVEPQPAVHGVAAEGQLCHARPVCEAQAAPVDVAGDLLDARHGAGRQPRQQRAGLQRRAEGQALVEHARTVARLSER